MKIEISPKDALRILGFLRELIPYDSDVPEQLSAMKETVERFNHSIVNVMNDELIDDAIAGIEVDALLGKSPAGHR